MNPKVEYLEPNEMLSLARREMDSIPQEKLFNDPRYQKLTERWCAGTFGIGYAKYVSSCLVAVNDDRYREDVDIFVKTADQIWEFQLAEVQQPGRRRGLEYRQAAAGESRAVGYDPDEGKVHGAEWLAEAARRKASKRYATSEKLNLLLYANFPARQLEHDQVVAKLEFLSGTFASVWVISSEYIGSIFSTDDLGAVKGWGLMRRIHNPYV